MPHHIPAENDLDRLGNEIAVLAACIDAATHRLLTLIAEFDRRSGWNDGGCRSCAHWLSWRIGLDLGAARERVRVARALEGLPRVSEAFRGEISYSKVRAITRVAKPETEEQLLGVARNGTAAQVERIVRGWRRVDAAEAGQARRQHEGRYLQMHTDEDGMLVIRGRLSPEHGAAFRRAIEAAEDKIFEDDPNGWVAPGGYHSRGSHRSGRARHYASYVAGHIRCHTERKPSLSLPGPGLVEP